MIQYYINYILINFEKKNNYNKKYIIYKINIIKIGLRVKQGLHVKLLQKQIVYYNIF